MITITRTKFSKDGIFGEMSDKNGHLCFTLEHAYDDGKGNWEPEYMNRCYGRPTLN